VGIKRRVLTEGMAFTQKGLAARKKKRPAWRTEGNSEAHPTPKLREGGASEKPVMGRRGDFWGSHCQFLGARQMKGPSLASLVKKSNWGLPTNPPPGRKKKGARRKRKRDKRKNRGLTLGTRVSNQHERPEGVKDWEQENRHFQT